MTPEQEIKIDNAIKLLNNIQLGEDVIFTESLRKRVLEDVILAGVTSSPTTITTTTFIGDAGGNVVHPKQYDKRLLIDVDGTNYYIGLYNI